MSGLCPQVINHISSNGSTNSGDSSGIPNINNNITIDTSNDVSVEQLDYIDISLGRSLRNRADFVQENGESIDLDVDANLGGDGNSNDDLRAREVRNEQSRKENNRFKMILTGVEQEEVNGDGTYMHEEGEILRKQTQEQNEERTQGRTIDQDDPRRTRDKEEGKSFTMHILEDNFIGRLLSWNNWDLALPSLRYNTNICPMLGRYMHQ